MSFGADDESSVLRDKGITEDCNLFVWDGQQVGPIPNPVRPFSFLVLVDEWVFSRQVGGEPMFPGQAHEPILLHVTYPKCGRGSEEGSCGQQSDDSSVEMVELNCGFPKNTALGHLRVKLIAAMLILMMLILSSLFFFFP